MAWDCSTCTDAQKRERNCDDESNDNISWAFAPSLRRCPWSQLDDEAQAYIDVWSHWKRYGETPWGGVIGSPQGVCEAITVCQVEAGRVELERAQSDARERERRCQTRAR